MIPALHQSVVGRALPVAEDLRMLEPPCGQALEHLGKSGTLADYA